MAVRDDLTFVTSASPRYILVDEGGAKDTELTIQDLVDTIRDFEDDSQNMAYKHMVDASGKENLGGSVKVGITATLQNTQVGFEARPPSTFIQCSITGGNLVAINEAGDSNISPIYTTAYTQVILTSSSSATLQDLDAIQYSSYQNAVWVDVVNGDSGTAYPAGTREHPVDNIPDAVIIANEKGFDTLQIIGDLTLGAGDNVESKAIIGQNCLQATLTIGDSAQTQNCEIKECVVTGILDGGNLLNNCCIETLKYVNGMILDSRLKGTITLGGNETASLYNCSSAIPGILVSIIDCGDSGQALNIKNYAGSLKIINKHGTDNITIDMSSGYVELDSTVDNGNIKVRGVGQIADNSTGSAVVDTCGLVEGSKLGSIYNETAGNREIVNNREYFYNYPDGDTAMVFLLLDQGGDSTMTNVYKRQRIY